MNSVFANFFRLLVIIIIYFLFIYLLLLLIPIHGCGLCSVILGLLPNIFKRHLISYLQITILSFKSSFSR